jgi:hypothetical protein
MKKILMFVGDYAEDSVEMVSLLSGVQAHRRRPSRRRWLIVFPGVPKTRIELERLSGFPRRCLSEWLSR